MKEWSHNEDEKTGIFIFHIGLSLKILFNFLREVNFLNNACVVEVCLSDCFQQRTKNVCSGRSSDMLQISTSKIFLTHYPGEIYSRMEIKYNCCTVANPYSFDRYGSGSSILGWIPIRIQEFLWPKIKQKLQLKKNIIFGSKTTIYLSLGLHKGRPSY